MANKETRIYKSDTLEQFRQKSNEVSLHLGDNEQLNSNLSDKTYNWVDVSAGDLFFKDTDDDSKTLRFEIKPQESLDNTAGYIILNDSPTIGQYFINGNVVSQSGGYSATIESVINQEKILVKNSSGTFNASQDLVATDSGNNANTSTIGNANLDRVEAESFNIGVVRVYKNGTELSQNLLEGGFHVPNYVAKVALSNTPDVSEFTEGSTVYQNSSQITTNLSDVQSNSNWYGVVLRASSTELLLKTRANVNSSFSAGAMIRLYGANDTIAAADHGEEVTVDSSYGNAIEFNNELAANDDIKIFSMDIVASINELQDDVGVTENLTTTATNLVNAVNEIEAVFDASTHEISAGSNAFNVTSGTFTLDSSADIILDADGADVILKDAGSEYGRLTNSSGQLQLQSNGSNVVLTANDTNATFNNNLVVEGTLDSDGDFEVGASKFNVVAASGNTQIDGTLDVDGAVTLDTNTTVGGTLGVTGATTLSSTLAVTGVGSFSTAVGIDGDFDINTNKFTVAASSGNTVIAGTLNVGSLNTSASDVRGAINEHESQINSNDTDIANLMTLIDGASTVDSSISFTGLDGTNIKSAINELASEKIDLSNDSEQTLDTDATFTSGNTLTFPSGSTLAIESGAALTIAGSATGVSTFGVDFLEVDGNQTATGMGLQVARDHIAGAPATDPRIQWRESRVTDGDPEKAWQVVGLNSANSGSQEQDIVTFYNAYHLIANNDENGINVSWDSTNENFNFDVDDFTITLGGDLTGSVTITDLASATLTATVAANSVALGTDTTGNYISTIAGTSNEIEVTGSGSETAAVTIGLPNAVDIVDLDVTATTNSTSTTTGALTVAGGVGIAEDVYIGGDLVVQGDSVTLNTETLTVEDTLVLAGNNLSSEPSSGGFGLEVGPITSPSGVASGVTGAHSIVYNYATDQWEADGSLILSSATLGNPTIESTTFDSGKNLVFAAGSGLSEAVTGLSGSTFTVTYTNTDKGSSQNIFKNVASDSGTAVADNNNDTLTLTGGNAISTSVSGDTVTIAHDDTSTLNGTIGGTNDGIVIEDITVDANGHVSAVGTRDLDGRFYQQSQFASANTASAPVIRDASGNFNAGTITATLSGTATNANNIEIDQKNDNVNYQVLFVTTNSSSHSRPYIDTDDSHLTYNPSTGRLTAPSVNATLLGNGASITSINASNISSGTISDSRLPGEISSNISGNAATATQVYVTENNSENNDLRVIFHDGANSGNTGLEHDDSFLYNPSSNIISGVSLSGNASTATKLATARTIAVSGAVTGSASFDGSANITIATTATSDPTLTLSGDASGSATFTNLGNATLSVALTANSVDSAQYVDGSIDAVHLSADCITAAKIGDDVINSEHYVAGSIDNEHLADNCVTAAKIAANAVGASEIAANAVTASEIAANAVGSSELADNAVDTAAIADDAVTAAKIAANAVGSSEIAADAVGSSEIAAGAVGASEIAANAVGDSELINTANFHMEGLMVGQTNGAIANTIRCTGDVVASFSSDERLKDNIIPIENSLEKVGNLKGYEFDWNNKQEVYEGHDVGVIAQEVEKVLPEIVETREHDGYKAVKYEKIIPLLINAINDLKAEIEELKDINS